MRALDENDRISVTVNNRETQVFGDLTILKSLVMEGIEIPSLCHDVRLKRSNGNCGLCVVEVSTDGEAPRDVKACTTPITPGMTITTHSQRLEDYRKVRLEQLLCDHNADCVAPCVQTCPANIDIQTYLKHVADGNYAAALRLNGQTDQAVAVLRKGVIAFPKDYEVSSAYGKALAANGNFEQALNVIRDAQRADRPDWRLYSAEGAILDQMGRTAEARDRYAKALAIAPGEPTILNNMALSHLLAGELSQSEQLLRQAAQSPNANSRIRQNLALVLGLQGRFPEAEQIARSELDPAQAEANVAYLKAMLAQANTWQQIKAGDKKQG